MALYLIPFYSVFPDIATNETRVITVLRTQGNVPTGSYGLIEFYCPDPDCDCRRVMLNIVEEKHPTRFLASIGYAFDPDDEMPGPYLDPMNPQSRYAEKLMEMVSDLVLTDAAYLERLERHYAMIKQAAADPDHPAHRKLQELEETSPEHVSEAPPPGPRIRRNDPCPCGSGKKYKHCCMNKAR